MSYLILAQERITLSYESLVGLFPRGIRFDVLNRRRTTAILIGAIAVFAFIYVGALYTTFIYGFHAARSVQDLEKMRNEVGSLGLSLQAATTNLAEEHGDVLESMEKISGVKYLAPARMTASLSAADVSP